jgi:hypothetical protein
LIPNLTNKKVEKRMKMKKIIILEIISNKINNNKK